MVIFPAILDYYRSTKDKTLRIVFSTNELTPEQVIGINEGVQQFGYVAFKKEAFREKEKKVLERLETNYEDGSKTPSQRLRAVLYVLWNQDNSGFDAFDNYYLHTMNTIIEHFKSKLA